MDFATVHRGYGQAIYDEWIRQLEQANAENSEAFYFASPIFPHFIALYENRLHLYKFLKIYAEINGDENLHKAVGLCEQLKELAVEAAQIGYENEYSKPEILAMTNNGRRSLLIDLLKKCRNLELEVAGCIKMFLDMPESYSPKKPEILNMVENMKEQGEAKMEILVKQLNDDFSIVECNEKQIIGVRMVCPPLARLNSIDIVRRSILEGTCSLLEKLAGNKNPGQYIAVMCDIRTGVDFTYIIGVEVDDRTVLPDVLPPDTVMLTIPAATFGKRRKKSDESANNALSSFSYSDFRKDMNYAYSDSSYPFSYYNADAEMLYTYQPVKQPQSDEEKYDSVSYEVVTLPDIKIIAKSGDNGECMWNFFKEMNTAEQTESAKLHLGNLVAFGGKNIRGEHGAYFGSRVTRFEDTPNGFEEAVYPSKLFARMYQKQTNNDNASILFDGGKDYFFKMHPEYEVDYADGFYDLFIFQYEQGVEVYVPIKKK